MRGVKTRVAHSCEQPVMAMPPVEEPWLVSDRFGRYRLSSHFQPVFSVAHRRAVGFEALLRAQAGGIHVGPLELFQTCTALDEVLLLDRMSRAVHVRNFVRQESGDTWLFLNMNPKVIAESKRFEPLFHRMLDHYGLPPNRVVVEILESAVQEERQLASTIASYRSLGCLIAIDDFGTGHSNFDRIWRLRPHIVKLDRSLVAQLTHDPSARSIVVGLVSLLHEVGSLVVMEGIECEQQALVALEADVDFVQGYYFAQPKSALIDPHAYMPSLSGLFDRFGHGADLDHRVRHDALAPYMAAIRHAGSMLEAGSPIRESCTGFLELPRSERCFLLDRNGMQIGSNLVSTTCLMGPHLSYAPLLDTSAANWSRRPYFRSARSEPGTVHVTRPYLSIVTATKCMTLSIGIDIDGDPHVLCGDIAGGCDTLATR